MGDTEETGRPAYRRRSFLKRAGIAGSGLAAVPAFAGTATASDWDPQYFYTRHYYCNDGETCSDVSEWSYSGWHEVPWGAGDITVVVHGYDNSHEAALSNFEMVHHELESIGYPGEVVGWSWESDISFEGAEQVAMADAKRLANFLQDHRDWYPDSNLRVLSHSLGARMVFIALWYLREKLDDERTLNSVHTLAAGVPTDWPSDEHLLKQVRDRTQSFYNYWNGEDSALYLWHLNEWGKHALGRHGALQGASCNYYDRDFTDHWGGDHAFSTYMHYCKYQVLNDMQDAWNDFANGCW